MTFHKIGWLIPLAAAVAFAQTGSADPAGVLSQLAVTRFVGSGVVSIQAMTSDAAGNIYVAASTTAPDLPTVDAAQRSGESLLMPSLDGVTVYGRPGLRFVCCPSKLTPSVFIAKLAPGGREVLWSTYLGGSNTDSPAAIAVDGNGNVIVTGNTSSPEFPLTTPRIGVQGTQNGFITKFDSSGSILSSLVFGGELSDTVTGLALDSQGAAYVSGYTTSLSFPITTGSTQPSFLTAFAAKFDPDGSLNYATYLPGYFSDLYARNAGVLIATEPTGSALLGYSGTLFRLSQDGLNSAPVASLPGSISNIAIGPRGNVFVSGEIQVGNTGSNVCQVSQYTYIHAVAGDIFVNKLHAGTLEPIYSARLYGHCESRPHALVVDAKGEATVGAVTLGDFPMLNPTLSLSPFAWEIGAAVVSRLSADGQQLLYSSYLDSYSSPALALAPDGSVYAGVTGDSGALAELGYTPPGRGAAVLQLPPIERPRRMTIRIAANAFDPAGVVMSGALLSITGENFTSLAADLGLNYTGSLPTELAGVQVLFDGVVAAQMIRAAPDQIICIVPTQLAQSNWTTVQVVSSSGQRSEPLVIPITTGPPGLLSESYPNAPIGPVQGIILNADGSPNASNHPAQVGSTVTVFGTGVAGPGPVPIYWNAVETIPLFISPQTVKATATPASGYVAGVYAITLAIPYLGPTPQTVPVIVGGIGSNVVVYIQ